MKLFFLSLLKVWTAIVIPIGVIFFSCGSNSNSTESHVLTTEERIETSNESQENNFYKYQCFLLDSGSVPIYDSFNGEQIGSIKNDYVNEDFFSISVIEMRERWLKVDATSIEIEESGWLKFTNNYFGTYSANYSSPLIIYDKPGIHSKLIFETKSYFTSPMGILDFIDGWLKVEFESGSEQIIGWVPLSMTCPSPYTTCN